MRRVGMLRPFSMATLVLVALFLLAACGAPAPGPTPAEPAAPAPADQEFVPTRGGGDLLRILYWQAPTMLNTHLAIGTKDFDASRLILEPLATIDSSGTLIPLLVE